MAGSIPNGPTGTASSAPARVAAWRKERLPHRVTRERLFEEDAPQIGMAVEHDAEEVVQDRVSMVQPLSSSRLRAQWLRAHLNVLALWSASVVLLSVAALVALGWL